MNYLCKIASGFKNINPEMAGFKKQVGKVVSKPLESAIERSKKMKRKQIAGIGGKLLQEGWKLTKGILKKAEVTDILKDAGAQAAAKKMFNIEGAIQHVVRKSQGKVSRADAEKLVKGKAALKSLQKKFNF